MVEKFIDLTNKNYLITGAASGIAKTTAIELSKYGANLILLDKDEKGLKATKRECKTKILSKTVDLLNVEDLINTVKSAILEFGKIDGLAHIAGIPSIIPLKIISQNDFDTIMHINTYPALELSKIFSNKKYRNEVGGSIIFISSIYANVGSAANVLYSASKSAIQGITKSLAIELAPKNIRVNCIAPGFINTQMGDKINNFFESNHNELVESMHPLGYGQTVDIANAIIFLLSDKARWITGSIMNVDGGFCAQ